MAPRQLNELDAAKDDVLRSIIGDGEDDAAENEEAPLGNEPAGDDEVDENDDTNDDIKFDDEDDDDDSATEPVAAKPEKPDQRPDPNDRFAFKEDRQGNLIDKDGRIVFAKGRQREIFTKLKKAFYAETDKNRSIVHTFSQTAEAAKLLLGRYNDLKATKNIAEQLGLNPAEAKEAAEMRAMMKLDPKQAIKTILTKMHLAGTDLKDIGVTQPLDAKTVAQHMIDMQKAAEPAAPTEEQKAKKEADDFLNRHPTARAYTNAIAQAKMRYPQMSLDEIWFQLVTWANSQKQKDATPPVARNGKKPNTPIPHNGSRKADMTPRGKLSIKAVDPTMSYSQIGKQLLLDIQKAERD